MNSANGSGGCFLLLRDVTEECENARRRHCNMNLMLQLEFWESQPA